MTWLDTFNDWSPSIRKRIKAIECESARKEITRLLRSLKANCIEKPVYDWQVRSLARSIERFIEGYETGFYTHHDKFGHHISSYWEETNA